MKILLCPDKFKGSLTASQVCDCLEAGISAVDPQIEIEKLPMADGGEGTLEVLTKLMELRPVTLSVLDPLFRPIEATYYFGEKKAFIEMATASGLQLLAEEERNCMDTTTYGTGELVADAILKGAKEIFLFVGGSATNDAGMGMAEALGYSFFDAKGNILPGIGRSLATLHDFKRTNTDLVLDKIKFYLVSDVDNKLHGPEGAARVYASQKGANRKEVDILDQGLENFHKISQQKCDIDLQDVKGSGAAGGIGGGGVVFLNAKIQSGIDTLMDLVDFDKKLATVDLVITGEGKLDHQTLQGKVVYGIYKACRKQNVPISVICGISELETSTLELMGFKHIVPLVDDETGIGVAIRDAARLIEMKAERLLD